MLRSNFPGSPGPIGGNNKAVSTAPIKRLAPVASTKPSDAPMQQRALADRKNLGLNGVSPVKRMPRVAPKAGNKGRSVARPRTGTK